MSTIEEIITDTLKFTEASLREAFDAGRASAAAELKTKLATFVTELIGPFEPQTTTSQTASDEAAANEHVAEHPVEGSNDDGQHTDHHNDSQYQQDGHYN